MHFNFKKCISPHIKLVRLQIIFKVNLGNMQGRQPTNNNTALILSVDSWGGKHPQHLIQGIKKERIPPGGQKRSTCLILVFSHMLTWLFHVLKAHNISFEKFVQHLSKNNMFCQLKKPSIIYINIMHFSFKYLTIN